MEYSLYHLTNTTQCDVLLFEAKSEQRNLVSKLELIKGCLEYATAAWQETNDDFLNEWRMLLQKEQEIEDAYAMTDQPVMRAAINSLLKKCAREGRALLSEWCRAAVMKELELKIIQTQLREHFLFVRQLKMKRKELIRA